MTPQSSPPTRAVARALLSVSDKTGLVEFGSQLAKLGVELVASGGTASALSAAGLEVVEVADLTNSPEMLGGRVKTLHPRIHGGILARRDNESDQAELEQYEIAEIDLVVVNLYPFEETVAQPGVALADAIEKIDIGGPSMIRSAAKNQAFVGVVADPADYEAVIGELSAQGGLSDATRRRLALKAFQRTAAYDSAIQTYLGEQIEGESAAPFPHQLSVSLPRVAQLRSQFARGEAKVEGEQDRTREYRGVQQFDERDAVFEQQCDDIASADSEFGETPGGLVGTRVKLRVAEHGVVALDRWECPRDPCARAEPRRNRAHCRTSRVRPWLQRSRASGSGRSPRPAVSGSSIAPSVIANGVARSSASSEAVARPAA